MVERSYSVAKVFKLIVANNMIFKHSLSVIAAKQFVIYQGLAATSGLDWHGSLRSENVTSSAELTEAIRNASLEILGIPDYCDKKCF